MVSEKDVMRLVYENYDDHQFNGYIPLQAVHEHPRLLQLDRLVGMGNRILDIGISMGDFSVFLKQKGNLVVGIDISSKAVKLSKARGIEAYRLNIETESLPDFEKFDVILMLEIIEHLIDPLPVLQKCRDILKPCGFLLLSTPNAAYLKWRLQLLLGKMPDFGENRAIGLVPRPYNLLHKTPLTVPNLKQLLALAGFSIVHFEPEDYGISKKWDKPGLRQFRQWIRQTWPNMFAGSVVVKGVIKK